MSQQQEIKIRALPRGNERKAAAGPSQAAAPTAVKPAATTPRWIIYVGALAVAALIGAFALPGVQSTRKTTVARATAAKTQKLDLSSIQDPVSAKITRHLQDAWMKQEMLRQRQALDNLKMKDPSVTEETAVLENPDRVYGVQMDQEDTLDKVYRDLNYRKPVSTDYLPDERISARLANRKWLSEHERAERINFVRNFIRSAYDRGYQVEIDQNLVVVGVKRITEPKKVNIDQVIERMAKQGL